MRFRGRLVDASTLLHFVQIMAKVKKQCVVKVNPTDFNLIIAGDSEGLTVWAGLKMRATFVTYTVESQNENNIGFTIQLDLLERALRSVADAVEPVMKLAKKANLAMLSISAKIVQGNGKIETDVVQDIPLALLSPQQLVMYVEPQTGDPDVYIILPSPLSTLKSSIERLKNISDNLHILVTNQKLMKLTTITDQAEVSVEFSGLEHPTMRGHESEELDPNIEAEVTIDAKNFSKVMQSTLINPESVILCLRNNDSCVVHTLAPQGDDFWMTFFIPVYETSTL